MDEDAFFRDVLQRIATGPTLSKNLPRADARRAMRQVLEGRADPVQAGIFLIALRMKRETDEELAGVLDAIHDGIQPQSVAVDRLYTLVDPYDGYRRCTPVAAFLPVVLAACGHRVMSHGVDSMGPKFGVTASRILAAAGYVEPLSLAAAASAIEDESCAWCHVDQSVLAPELAALAPLRTRIVKRPCLTTIEVAVQALRPRQRSILATGFVHKGYPEIYAALASAGGFQRSVIVRGVEGGLLPSLSQASRYFVADSGDALTQHDMEPVSLGIEHDERAPALPDGLLESHTGVRSVGDAADPFATTVATHAAQLGLDALAGEGGMARDALVFAAAILLVADGHADDLADAAARVRVVLDDGSARQRFAASCARSA